MKKLPLAEVKPGMILAKLLATQGGRTLLSAGTVLTESYLKMMEKHGFDHIFVEGGEEAFKEEFPSVGYDVFGREWDDVLAEINHKFELVQDNVVMLQLKKAVVKYLEELKERYA